MRGVVGADCHAICVLERVLDMVPADEAAWRGVGVAAARLNAHRDYPHGYRVRTDGALAEMAREAVGRPFERPYLRLLETLKDVPHASERGLVHGQPGEHTAGRRQEGTVVLLDWDEAGHAPVCLDYGFPLVVHFVSVEDHDFDRAKASAFYRGYVEAGGAVGREDAFAAGLFHAMRYMFFTDTDRRWERVLYAVEHKDELLSVLP